MVEDKKNSGLFKRALGCLLLGLVAAACGGGGSASDDAGFDACVGDGCADECTLDSDCPEGQLCNQGTRECESEIDVGDAGPSPLDPTAVDSLYEQNAFWFEGDGAGQVGVAPGTIVPEQIVMIRGYVRARDNTPLGGVTISIHDHPEFGTTLSDANGEYAMAVNGGGSLHVRYELEGYLGADRRSQSSWEEYTWADDVVLIPLSTKATPIASNASQAQVADGELSSDSDGERTGVLIFPAGTTAERIDVDGNATPLSEMTVRVTEYTVGNEGVDAMPATLPPSTGYTYAAEYSIDEALAVDAAEVRFNQPVYFYLENFIGFPVGDEVPTGYFDRQKASWVQSENGRVLGVVGIANGLATVDVDGDGQADASGALAALGITEEELAILGDRYQPGQSLWRVPIAHFSTWDHNWGGAPPDDARFGGRGRGSRGECEGSNDPSLQSAGSIIECANRSFRDSIEIVGTNTSLVYSSSRALDFTLGNQLELTLSDETVPESCTAIKLEVLVAGQRFTNTFPCAPDQKFTYEWDGLDLWGRVVEDSVEATVRIGYVYEFIYKKTDCFSCQTTDEPTYANLKLSREGDGIIFWRREKLPIGGGGGKQHAKNSVGGFSVAGHHRLERRQSRLLMGDGTFRTYQGAELTPFDDTVDVTREDSYVFAPDGSLFYLGTIPNLIDHRVILRSPDGSLEALTGPRDFENFNLRCPDSGLASQSYMEGVDSMALGSDGTLYVSHRNGVATIFRDESGDWQIRSVIAGEGVDCADPNVFRVDLALGSSTGAGLQSIQVDSAGTLYGRKFSFNLLTRISGIDPRRPTSPLQIETTTAPSGAGEMVVGPDDDLYYVVGGRRIVRGSDGSSIAGSAITAGTSRGFGGPADEAVLSDVRGLQVGVDGEVFFTVVLSDAAGFRQEVWSASGERLESILSPTGANRGVKSAHPSGNIILTTGVQNGLQRIKLQAVAPKLAGNRVASRDGTLLYDFSRAGRHLRTLSADTGATLQSFEYDDQGQLSAVEDAYGNRTSIERDDAGNPRKIIAPFGQETLLEVDTDGYLSKVTNPAGESVQLLFHEPRALGGGGLLASMTDAKGYEHLYEYGPQGELLSDSMPLGIKTLSGSGGQSAVTTELGRRTEYTLGSVDSDECPGVNPFCHETRVRQPDGTERVTYRNDNRLGKILMPEGHVMEARGARGPRFGNAVPFTQAGTLTYPSGLEMVLSQDRQVVLADPVDPLSIQSRTNTSTLNGNTYETVYTRAGNSVRHVTPEGLTSTAFFDELERVVRVELPGELPITAEYESRGRLSAIRQGVRHTLYSYDPASGYVSEVREFVRGTMASPEYETTQYVHDAAGRITTITYPDGNTLEREFDLNGNVTGLQTPGGAEHNFAFGPLDIPESYTPPTLGDGEPRVESQMLNVDAQTVGVLLPDGRAIGFTYGQSTGRFLQADLGSDGSVAVTHNPSGQVAKLSRIDSLMGVVQDTEYSYDGPDLVRTEWQGPVVGSVELDLANFATSSSIVETLNAADAITYLLDGDNRITSAGPVELTYEPVTGLFAERTTGDVAASGITESLTYSEFGEVSGWDSASATRSYLSAAYSRDGLGRLVGISEVADGASRDELYRFDNRGWLTTVTDDNGNTLYEFAYDENGNRLSGPGAAANTVSYNSHDELLSYGNAVFSYTLNGEVASRVDTEGSANYTYDAFSSLRSVSLDDGVSAPVVVEYLNDGEDRRVARFVDSVFDYGLIYGSTGRAAGKVDASGTLIQRYIYASSGLAPDAMTTSDGRTFAFVRDHVDSIRQVIDVSDGSIVQAITYDVFGNIESDTNPGFQPFGFAGGLYDPLTGLTNFAAREYDPRIGRFMQRDPAGFPHGGNRYVYAENDPINTIDPFGYINWMKWGDRVSNFSAGFGDALTFGLTRKARKSLDVDDVVDRCSGAYGAGGVAGELVRDELAGVAVLKGAAKLGGLARKAKCLASFAAGTPVTTKDGSKYIEDIQPGDWVLAKNEASGAMSWRQVTQAQRVGHKPTLELTLSMTGRDEAVLRDVLTVTEEHPFWVRGHGELPGRWVKAAALEAGDVVESAFDGSGSGQVVVESVEPGEVAGVYNFAVEGDATYFVGKFAAWVHNAKGCDVKFKSRDALRNHNRVATDAARKAGLSRAQRRELHDAISGQGFDYHEVVEIAQQIKNGAY